MTSGGKCRSVLLALGCLVAGLGLAGPLAPVPAGAAEPGPTGSVLEPTPEPDPPVVVLPPVDTAQPPARVGVLPRRCVGAGTMPTTARACEVLRAGARRPLVVVWGDSHSWQQTRGIIQAARDNREALVTFQMGGCPPMLLEATESRSTCAELGRTAIATIRAQARERPVRVVVGAYWHGYLVPVAEDSNVSRQAALFRIGGPRAFATLDRMRNVRTVAIGQQPTLGLGVAIPGVDLPRAQVVRDEAEIDAWLRPNVDRVVSPTALLCDPLICLSSVAGRSVYSDSLHLDPALSDRLRGAYRNALR